MTINRPEVMNALHPPAQQEMEKVFDDFQNDPEQWIAIVTGAGDKAFSAGNDLKFQAEHGSAAVRDGLQGVKGGFGGLHRRTDLYKPVIAAVNGFALGGGFEIVLSCDIIIAAEHATFGLPEPRVGLMAGAGGVHRLPRQIPYHIAMGMMLTGRRVTRARRASATVWSTRWCRRPTCWRPRASGRGRSWSARRCRSAPARRPRSKVSA